MPIGILDKKENILINYKTWGTSGDIKIEPVKYSLNEKKLILSKLKKWEIIDSDYKSEFISNRINLYQGKFIDKVQCILLCFQPISDGSNFINEYVSVIFDFERNRLLGFTKMLKKFDEEIAISHQMALDKGVKFLQDVACDLVPINIKVPNLLNLNITDKIKFIPPFKLGNVELNWIDSHIETFIDNGSIRKVVGMKIKLFIPRTKLWAWMIVSNSGEIITFERDISWNFDLMKRETQMWLHDKWLKEQKIKI